ncbi:hypothetical protein J6590_024014 [Homalodisca vitripennis]|nr:hypothetical protein J6590_024014 [Homalodisca vitripennis]
MLFVGHSKPNALTAMRGSLVGGNMKYIYAPTRRAVTISIFSNDRESRSAFVSCEQSATIVTVGTVPPLKLLPVSRQPTLAEH